MADKIVVMNAGRVEQIGPPLKLYDDPANLFVAGFIGSPAMNFIHGTIDRAAGSGGVRLADGSSLPAPHLAAAGESREVVIGVRPEHFVVDAGGIPAEVIVVEPTGMDTQIYCNLSGTEVAAVVRERHTFRPGEMIRLAPSLTYLFDPGSGQRLR